MLAVQLIAFLVPFSSLAFVALQPNPPKWPESVKVFSPTNSTAAIEDAVNSAFKTNGGQKDHGQFSTYRYAFLFKPGSYEAQVPVGYYTQVLGLGSSPNDVKFTSEKGVYCEEGDYTFTVGALNTFWRAAENFHTSANYNWFGGYEGMLWAASQASPLRRIMVDEKLVLYQYYDDGSHPGAAGYSSGGFIADVKVNGSVSFGSQQQFFTRSCEFGAGDQAVWNTVHVGSSGVPKSHCGRTKTIPGSPMISIDSVPIVREKPFISVDSSGKYTLNVPEVRINSTGTSWASGSEKLDTRDFSKIYVTKPSDTADTINQMLFMGLDVVVSPGIYNLTDSLKVQKEDQVILGLGMATLVSSTGKPCIEVSDVDGVTIAGLMLGAGTVKSPSLLKWGTGNFKGDRANPGFIHDVFVRVGGTNDVNVNEVSTELMIDLQNGNIIGDNLWLWRADHDQSGQVYGGANPCSTGLNVDGDDVIMYGLFVEHTLKNLVTWNGERGRTYFYQSELPYDATTAYGTSGYASYVVNEDVKDHDAWGVGVYSYFRDYDVVVESGIKAPENLVERFWAPFTVFLNGTGSVKHIINEHGNAVTSQSQQWLCPDVPPVEGNCNKQQLDSCFPDDPTQPRCPTNIPVGKEAFCNPSTGGCAQGDRPAPAQDWCCYAYCPDGPAPTPSSPPSPSPSPSVPSPSPTSPHPSPPPSPSPGKCSDSDVESCKSFCSTDPSVLTGKPGYCNPQTSACSYGQRPGEDWCCYINC